MPPLPSGPAKLKNTVLSGMVGVILALAIAFLRFFLDTTIKTSEDVEKYLGLSTLGSIPITKSNEQPKGKTLKKKKATGIKKATGGKK